ncbi:MAG: helix-turn-helix transcriptional regulator [Prevotella sp.]|nr:helix-turn-helix transcriptional regulator [Prevotella sp.]
MTAYNKKTTSLWIFDEGEERWRRMSMPQLSDKEKEVLSLAAQGFMTKEIADILNRTESTIETHRRALFRKLKATNMMEAVGYAMAYHLL